MRSLRRLLGPALARELKSRGASWNSQSIATVPGSAMTPSSHRRTTFLGATVGVTVGTITATLVSWPVADILLAPWFIRSAMERPNQASPSPAASLAIPTTDIRALRQMACQSSATVVVLTGGTREQRLALAVEASRDRPLLRVSLRQATAPHSMLMAVVDSLYRPLTCAPLLSCLGTVWLTLFDMLIADHEHTRQRDLCVCLAQTSRALRQVKEPSGSGRQKSSAERAGTPRPLIIVEHLFVPMDSAAEPRGEGLSPMLRTLRQWLCHVSIDTDMADVLVLTPTGSVAGENAMAAWRGEARRSCADRITMSGGAVALALTQSEAVDRWVGGCLLRQS